MENGVSVVIPAYNYARFLANAIDSALRQDYSPIEVIVVDDGSVDETRSVVESYRDERVRYIYQTNAGLSAARNTGIANARHDYIAFLDADDEWLPEMLGTVMRKFAALPSRFGLVATASVYMDTAGTPRPPKPSAQFSDCEVTVRDIIARTRFMPSTAVARRRVFDGCGTFDVSLRSSEDRDMWMRIAARHGVFLISKPLVLIRKHPGNMSKHATRMKENTIRVIRKAYRNRVVSRWDFLFWLHVLGIFYFDTAWAHYDEGRRGEALFYLLASLLCWPGSLSGAHLNEPPFFRLRALVHFVFKGAQARLCDRLFCRHPIHPTRV